MPIVGKVELKSDKNVKAGVETSLSDLFPSTERSKKFTLETDIEYDKTKLKIAVSKLGTLETTADTTEKKGQKTSLLVLIKVTDSLIGVKASENIKKGDALSVTVKTA